MPRPAYPNYAKPCARQHCVRPVLRPDSKYCSRRCGFEQRPTGANNHRIFVNPSESQVRQMLLERSPSPPANTEGER